MEVKRRYFLISGILILIILGISFLIPIQVESGGNYNVETPLLGILIFYSPIVLAVYLIIAIFLIIVGIKHS